MSENQILAQIRYSKSNRKFHRLPIPARREVVERLKQFGKVTEEVIKAELGRKK
jgi:predicted transcriptional regulator